MNFLRPVTLRSSPARAWGLRSWPSTGFLDERRAHPSTMNEIREFDRSREPLRAPTGNSRVLSHYFLVHAEPGPDRGTILDEIRGVERAKRADKAERAPSAAHTPARPPGEH